MDEIVVAQNKYISSKRASRVSGYAQDYVGQLVRMGRIPATKVGKAWFVDEAALLSHVNGSNRIESPARELATLSARASAFYQSQVTAGITYPKTWSPVSYITDDSPLLPSSDSRDTDVLENSFVGSSDESASERVSIRVQRAKMHVVLPVRATTFDGVRFSIDDSQIPAVVLDQSEQEKPAAVLTSSRLSSISGMETFFRAVFAGFVAAVLIFFVPIFG